MSGWWEEQAERSGMPALVGVNRGPDTNPQWGPLQRHIRAALLTMGDTERRNERPRLMAGLGRAACGGLARAGRGLRGWLWGYPGGWGRIRACLAVGCWESSAPLLPCTRCQTPSPAPRLTPAPRTPR